jgi:hypothetical protein
VILPYDAVRVSGDPDELLLGFLQETYAGAAELAKWDRKALEREFRATRWSMATRMKPQDATSLRLETRGLEALASFSSRSLSAERLRLTAWAGR